LGRGFAEGGDGGGKDAADALTDQLEALLAEGEDPLTRALAALVERAASLEEVRDGLVALLPELSDRRLAELMVQALIVANLQGRADLADGV
jgi:phage gp29-like protein